MPRMRTQFGALIACASVAGCAAGFEMTSDIEGRECASIVASNNESLRWVIPLREGKILEPWCGAVGAPVFRRSHTRTQARFSRDDSITVAAWNVSVGGADIVAFLEGMGVSCGDGALAGQHIVLLAQEAMRSSNALPALTGGMKHQRRVSEQPKEAPRRDIVEVAEFCDLHLVYVPSSRNGGDDGGTPEDLGSAILSTLPLSEPFAVEMPKEASRRVAVGATIRGDGDDEILLVSVHFNTFPGPWKLLRTGNSSRVRQALALIEALEVVNQDSLDAVPIIAGGDLNTWSVHEGAMKQLRSYFAASPEWHGKPTRGSFPTDHLLLYLPNGKGRFSAPVALEDYNRVDDTYNSDHNPIVASIIRGR